MRPIDQSDRLSCRFRIKFSPLSMKLKTICSLSRPWPVAVDWFENCLESGDFLTAFTTLEPATPRNPTSRQKKMNEPSLSSF
jgi:hypothetical protein